MNGSNEINYVCIVRPLSKPSKLTKNQHEPDNERSPENVKLSKFCGKSSNYFSQCFEKQTNRYCQVSLESRKSKERQPKSTTRELPCFKNNQDERAPNTYVSPYRSD